MLCRALLTAAAISCTLSRATSQVQGTQRLVQIKDLICVLLLSGLQKDDLDVNTLKKLQRHNVNIDDMNNANLRQECISTTTENINNIQNIMNTDYGENKTTMDTYTFDKRSETSGSRMKDLRKKNLEDVMQYLMNNSNNNNENAHYNDFTTITEDDQNRGNLESMVKNLKLAKINIKPQTINEKTDDIEIITTPKIKKLGNNYVLPAKDVDYIGGFLAEYIAKKRILTTSEPPKSNHNDDKSISQKLNGFMNVEGLSPIIRSLLEQKNKDNIINLKNNNFKRRNYFDEIINKTETNQNIRTMEPIKIYEERERSKNSSLLITLDDIIMLKETLKNFTLITTTENIFYYRHSESDKHPEVGRSTPNENGYTKPKSTTDDKQDNSMSTNIIKEIARTIKDIIIKDLKKEITTAATIMTSKSTTELTTTTPKPQKEKAKEATHVIEKIMEMFQQLKTIKESTIITADGKLKMTEKKDVKHEYTGPVKFVYQSSGPGYPYNLMPISPIIQQSTNTFVARNIPQNINSMLPLIYSNPINVKPAPITIQTNSNEIPPLGIPISKPMNIMNIVVTTQEPARDKSERHYRDYNFKRDKNYDDEENRYHSERLQKYSYLPEHLQSYNPLHNFRGKHRIDMSRDRKPRYKDDLSNYRSRNYKAHYDDGSSHDRSRNHKAHYDDGSSHDRSRNYKAHYDDGSSHDRPRSDAKRFHERLETNEWPRIGSRDKVNDRDDCCKIEVASRQQLPLNSIKKVSGYDDTHFNNFLKTQQKVNAMLERILATKTKYDGPHGDDRNIEFP